MYLLVYVEHWLTRHYSARVKTSMGMRGSFAALASAILFLSGCGHGLDEAMMKQSSRQGVYAQTASGLVEISRYGAFTPDPFTQLATFKFDSSIPQVAGPIGFVANTPDALMSDARVFPVSSIEAGIWHRGFTSASDTKPPAIKCVLRCGFDLQDHSRPSERRNRLPVSLAENAFERRRPNVRDSNQEMSLVMRMAGNAPRHESTGADGARVI